MKPETFARFTEVMIVVALAALAVTVFWGVVNAQTPPVSTVGQMPDTLTTMDVVVPFTVASSIPWYSGGGVGLYYRIPGVTGWLYIAGSYYSPIIFFAPADNTVYQFATTVDDNDGNSEGYEFEPEAEVYVCTACIPGGCPPFTKLEAVQLLAEQGIMSWGQADTPTVHWYWAHPTTGTAVASYTMEFQTLSAAGDTGRATFPGLVDMDSLYGHATTPYPMHGELQRVSVYGVDASGSEGPVSNWSLWFGDDGPPGQPGTPLKYLEMVE